MSKFDETLWRERAWARFTRAVSSCSPKDKEATAAAERTWAQDVLAIGDLSKIVGWCAERCIDVNFVKKSLGTYHGDIKEISISSRLHPRNQSIVLLHECGHHLIGHVEHHDRFGMGYPQTDPQVTKTLLHRVSVLDEEMDAWHRGWKLSQRLDLCLDRDTFDKVRLDCIKSYLQWALKPGRKRPE